jgi:hypothetical protein
LLKEQRAESGYKVSEAKKRPTLELKALADNDNIINSIHTGFAWIRCRQKIDVLGKASIPRIKYTLLTVRPLSIPPAWGLR